MDPARAEPFVASKKHLARLIAILLAVALAGYWALRHASPSGSATAGGGNVGLYLGLLAAEWGLFAFVRMGLKHHCTPIASLISGRPLTWRALAIDLLLGLALMAVLIGAEALLARLFGAGDRTIVQTFLVRRLALVPLWLLLALSAGFVEEFTFRGYLQRQLGAWFGRPWLGIVAQAVLFGITHGYQGGTLIASITMLGLAFGVVASLRRSLVPGIIAHAGMDILAGLAIFG